MRSLRQSWSKRVITTTIQELHKAGERLNSNHAQTKRQALYGAAIKYFGSWGKAVKAAGFDYAKIRVVKHRSWSKEKILRAVRRRKRLHLSLNASIVEREDRGLYWAARRHFGRRGWRKVLRRIGVDPRRIDPRRIWTKARFRKRIRELKRAGVPLYTYYLQKHGYGHLIGAGCKLFGTWGKALEAAGLNYERIRRIRMNWWNQRRVIAGIRRLKKRRVRLSSKATSLSHGALFRAAVVYFGSWAQAVTAAGIDYRRHCKTWSYKAWLRTLTPKKVKSVERRAERLARKMRGG